MERDEPRPPAPEGDPSTPSSPAPPLPWPPPGLARIQGDAWWVARKLSVGGLILAVPLLLTMTARHPFELGGALADAWWVATLTTGMGALLLAFAFRDLGRLLGRSGQALRQGHGRLTVSLAAVDRGRDMGFLLQGERHFSGMHPRVRRGLATIRTLAAGVLLLGSLWIPVGFTLGLLMGTRGLLEGPLSVFLLTLVPYGAALLLTGFLLLWDRTVVRRARESWHRQPWSHDLDRKAVDLWSRTFDEKVHPSVAVRGSGDGAGVASVARGAVYAAGAVTILIALLLSGIMFIASTLAAVSTPVFGTLIPRGMADVEVLRRYVVEADPDLDPQEAGEVFQVLLRVGVELDDRPTVRPPVRHHPEPWLPPNPPGEDRPRPVDPEWRTSLLERGGTGLEPWEPGYLRELTGHPAAADFSRLARARSIDVFHGTVEMPLPPGTPLTALPIPRPGALREGGVAHHLLEAALLASEGRVDEAEIRVREVISMGVLLADESPWLIDNLVGTVIARTGGDALEALFRGTGRETEARELAWARAAAVRTAERARSRAPLSSRQGLREMSHVVGDTTAVRGIRWEMFMGLSTASACLNLDRIVFGPGPEHERWVEEARASLVRWPSEEEIFDMARFGYFGHAGEPERPYLFLRPLIWLMGGADEPGSCGAAVARIQGGV